MSEFSGGMCIGILLGTLLCFLFADSDIQPFSYQYAEKVCSVNNGVKYLSEGFTRYASVTCNNGAEFSFELNKVKENIEK